MKTDDKSLENINRTLRLLWRNRLGEGEARRGPKQRLSVEKVIQVGIEIADAEGLDALTIRKAAERLKIGTMSLYTYVPGRAELIALMADQVMGETELPPHPQSLRGRLRAIARLTWDETHRHPWLLQAASSRPWVGPNSVERYEWQLTAIEHQGFTDIEMDQIVALLTGTAENLARVSINMQTARATSDLTDAEWWSLHGPILSQLMRDEDYPVAARVGQAAGEEYNSATDPERTFEFALERIIDGLELLLERRATKTTT